MLEKIAITVTSAGPATVLADEGQLGQIVMNLVVNARDAMPAGEAAAIDISEVDLVAAVASALGILPGR
ncbi:MAG: hypothetical protein EXQ55_04000 [Acidobacteria bacterium]|nr:hypothetical protein [Acidobacteriota bacterium]